MGRLDAPWGTRRGSIEWVDVFWLWGMNGAGLVYFSKMVYKDFSFLGLGFIW